MLLGMMRFLGALAFSKPFLTPAALNSVPGLAHLVEKSVFDLFCGGTSIDQAKEVLQQLQDKRITGILDYAVENDAEEGAAEATKQELMNAIEAASAMRPKASCALKLTALFPPELLQRKQAAGMLSIQEEKQWQTAFDQSRAICAHAERHGAQLLVDAEESWIQGSIGTLTKELMAEFNKEQAIVVTTIQMYLREGLAELSSLLEDADSRDYLVGLKLVRGAYLEKESERSDAMGLKNPINETKEETDAAYNMGVERCLDRIDRVSLIAATHNVENINRLVEGMEQRGIEPSHPHVANAQLYGMADYISLPLVQQGYNTLKYVPYGPTDKVAPYLIRRVEENSAVSEQAATAAQFINTAIKDRLVS